MSIAQFAPLALGLAPMAAQLLPGAGGKKIRESAMMRGIGHAGNILGAVQTAGMVKDLVAPPKPPPSPKYQTPGQPITSVAADLRATAAQAVPSALTTEGAVAATDKALPSADGQAAQPAKAAADSTVTIAANDDRGTFSTQRAAGRVADVLDVGTVGRPLAPATSPKGKLKVAFDTSLWSPVASTLKTVLPAAAGVVTIGGAALTAKGIHDSFRNDRDRAARLANEAEQRQRDIQFHRARMHALGADPAMSMSPWLDPSLGSPVKGASFDPRVPLPAAPPKPAASNRIVDLLKSTDEILGRPVQDAVGPTSIQFSHLPSHTLTV